MEKIKVKEKVFSYVWDFHKESFTLKDFGDFDLLDTDEINLNYDEGYYSENNSWGEFTELSVFRERDETDEELSKRDYKDKLEIKWARDRRYQTYLLYKKEFDE